MKQFRHFSTLTAFAMLAFAGCSSTDTPLPPQTYPQITYVKGTSYTYYQVALDSSGKIVAGSGDTITSTVIDTSAIYHAKSSVTVLANKHSNGSANDTTYIAQDSGNFWHYNYGLESANTNQAVLNFNGGHKIVSGWVLQAKLSAQSGDTWTAANEGISISTGTITFKDVATESVDSSFSINGSTASSKHSVHQISLDATIAKATGTVDTYVAADLGPVLNIVHPASVPYGMTTIHANGTQTILLKKN